MKNFKEMAIGIVLLLVIVIGGSIYNDVLGGLWYKLINAISNIF